MKVILTDDVVGLGDIGEIVKVRPGYARNFLIPRGLALETAAASARVVAHRMQQIEVKKRKLKTSAAALGEKLRSLSIEIGLRVGTGGRVFGSIGTRDIAAELQKQGFDIDRRRVVLSEPIKKLGTHFVNVRLHPEVQTSVKHQVTQIAANKEDEETAVAAVRESLEDAAEARDDSDAETEETELQ